MRRLLTAAALLTVNALVHASEFYIEWEAPTAREDGTPLQNSEIIRYNIKVKTPGNTEYQDLAPIISQANQDRYNTSYALDNVGGEYCFQLQTLDANDFTSKWTDPICLTYLPVVAPLMPGNVIIEIRIKP